LAGVPARSSTTARWPASQSVSAKRSCAPADLGRYGEVSVVGPVAGLKVDRAHTGEVLAAILDRHTLVDMSIQDPPLDQVIAMMFEEGRARHEEEVAAAAK
jgi:hypothetical protein